VGLMSDADAGHDYISYEDFGVQFFARAVTEARILGGVNTLAGQPINVGPMGVGPGRIAKVTAKGAIGEASATPIPGDIVSYRVVLPVSLTFDVDLQVDSHRFTADLEVPLTLVARAASPLKVVIDVVPPLPNQVTVKLRAEGIRASMLNKVVGIDTELQRFVAKYVKREVTKPAVAAARVIDVARAMDGAWSSISPKGSARSTVTEDLETAFEQEILENPDLVEGLTSE
jgi:hypothetical protein